MAALPLVLTLPPMRGLRDVHGRPVTTPPPQASLSRRLGLATLLMVSSVMLSRVVGFVREAVIAAQQGATGNTDAYFAAFTLPDMLNYFLAGGTLSITFIPLFSRFIADGDEEGGWKLFSTIATGVGALVFVAVLVAEVFAPELVPLLTPGFDTEQLALCVRLTRIVLPGMLCFTIGGLLQATLLSKERFGWVATIPILYNVMIILGGVLLGPLVGVEGFAWGALSGAFLGPLLVPLLATWKTLRYRPRFDFHASGFRDYIRLALPLMIGVSLISLDEWLLRYFGSYFDQGTVTHLNNARRIMLVPFAIIGQAAGQAALPFLSRLHNEGKQAEMAETLTRSLASVVFFAVVASTGLAVLARPTVFAAYQRGQFSVTDANETAALLTVFCVGIAAWSAQTVAARGYYARQNTLEPMLIGTVVVVLAAPLYAVLGHKFGAEGLALASSLGITLNATAVLIAFRLRHAPIGLGSIAAALGKGLLCGLPGGLAAAATLWALGDVLRIETTVGAMTRLLLGAAIFGGVAFGLAGLGGVREMEFLTARLRKLAAKVRRRPSS